MWLTSDLCLADYLVESCVTVKVYLSQYFHDFADESQNAFKGKSSSFDLENFNLHVYLELLNSFFKKTITHVC